MEFWRFICRLMLLDWLFGSHVNHDSHDNDNGYIDCHHHDCNDSYRYDDISDDFDGYGLPDDYDPIDNYDSWDDEY